MILFRQARVEHAPHLDVVSVSSRAQDDASARAHVDRLVRRLEVPVDLHEGRAHHASAPIALANHARHLVRQEDSTPFCRALFSSARTIPDPFRRWSSATSSLRIGHSFGLTCRGSVEASESPEKIEIPIEAVRGQEVVGGDRLIGKLANQLSVVESRFLVVGARPVGEQLVGRVVHALLLLEAVAAAEMDHAAAHDRDPADVEVLLDEEHRGALVARSDRCRQSRRARADDDDVHLPVPSDALRLRFNRRAQSRDDSGTADAGRCARFEELASGGAGRRFPVAPGAVVSIVYGHGVPSGTFRAGL